MKLLMIAVLVTFTAACSGPMPPQEMAAKIKVCKENGLAAHGVYRGFSDVPVDIACTIPKPKQR